METNYKLSYDSSPSLAIVCRPSTWVIIPATQNLTSTSYDTTVCNTGFSTFIHATWKPIIAWNPSIFNVVSKNEPSWHISRIFTNINSANNAWTTITRSRKENTWAHEKEIKQVFCKNVIFQCKK